MKRKCKTFQVGILGIVLLASLVVIATPGCPKHNKGTKTGSSNAVFIINAPSNLTAITLSFTQINLFWGDNSSNNDGFSIERSDGNNQNYLEIDRLGPDATAYLDSGLFPGGTYYYRIRAFNNIGDYSVYSNEAYTNTFILSCFNITVGSYHSFAMMNNGTLWGWGANATFQLGVGDNIDRVVPYQLGPETDWSVLSAGGGEGAIGIFGHTIAVKTNMSLWGWGLNSNGQLGTGDTGLDEAVPYQIGTNFDWSKSACGWMHTIGLKSTGTLWSWGFTENGQLGLGYSGLTWSGVYVSTPTQIGTDSDWSTTTSIYDHSLAIKTDKSLWSWGPNSDGRLGLGDYTDRTTPSIVGTVSDWVEVACGYSHSIARKEDSTIWAWGNNNDGKLGLGDEIGRNTPSIIGTDSDWVKIAGGGDYTIARKTNSTLWLWGNNNYGQLGLGDTKKRLSPTQVGFDSDWLTVGAGQYHTIGLKSNGTVWVWGRNNNGQLGTGDTNNRFVPTLIEIGTPSAPISLIVTLVSSNQINLSWMDISNSETGFRIERKINRAGTYQEIESVGQDVTSYSDITSANLAPNTYYYYRVRAFNVLGYSLYSNEAWIALSGNWAEVTGGSGSCHTIVRKADNSLWAWGNNQYGKLGLGDTAIRSIPTQIGSDSDWFTIATGGIVFSSPPGIVGHSLAIKSNGSIWSWGYNNNAQLGLGDRINRNTPSVIGTDSDWVEIIGGQVHTVARKTDSTIWSWGSNVYGQLGLGVTIGSSIPTNIGTTSDWIKVVGGLWHTLACKTNGTLWSWGNNWSGQLGLGDVIQRNTPSVIGDNSDWVKVAAGYEHSIAIKSDSTLWAWGQNGNGQLGLGDIIGPMVPTNVGTGSDWLEITAGSIHTLARKSDGTLWSWGYNYYGQLGMGDTAERNTPTQVGTLSDWVEIDGGYCYSVARRLNSTLWSWGYNEYGQLGLGDMINRNVPTLVGE